MGARHRIGWLASGWRARARDEAAWRSIAALIAILVLATGAAFGVALLRPTTAAAQDACVADTEPNDQPSAQVIHADAFCVEGQLPDKDQDLFAWEVSPEDATTRWTFSLSGVEDALTVVR